MGLAEPELGGDPSLVDVVGLNFYPHNQWYFEGPTIPMGHHEYKPLADMLVEVAERYGKPVFISETGAEGSGRPAWLHYVCDEVRAAQGRGTDVRGHLPVPGHRLPRLGQSAGIARSACSHRSARTASATSTSRSPRSCSASGRSSASDEEPAGERHAAADSPLIRRPALSAGRPTECRRCGQPSRHSIRSISRIRRLLISSSCRWRGRFTSIA